jgi:hypothetical protein
MPGGAFSIELLRPETKTSSPVRVVMVAVVRAGSPVATDGDNDGAFEDFDCCCCSCHNFSHSLRRERNFDIFTSVSCIGRQNIFVLIQNMHLKSTLK